MKLQKYTSVREQESKEKVVLVFFPFLAFTFWSLEPDSGMANFGFGLYSLCSVSSDSGLLAGLLDSVSSDSKLCCQFTDYLRRIGFCCVD